MRSLNTFPFTQVKRFSKRPVNLSYDIPERYENAFYLANASFFDSTNWFLHKAYESVFSTLKNDLKITPEGQNLSENNAHMKLENVVEVFDQCNSIIDVRFPVRRDSGRYEVVRGFRANYGQMVANGACLGGLRILDTLTRDHMKALSVLSTMKNACLGIGMAGAHGGIKINVKNYSQNELRNIVDLYVTELYKKGYCNLGDVVHPDINTSESEMDWISKSLEILPGEFSSASVVGKSLQNGGIENFEKTAAFGASRALDIFLEDEKLMTRVGLSTGLTGKRFIIEGLGKVGVNLAKFLVQNGAVCVGVKEKEAYIYDKKGIDIQALIDYRSKKGTIENFGLSKTDNPDSIFGEDCDILVLAACHKSLVCYTARNVQAKVILEAADGAMTPSAHRILTTKSRLVIPDIYALGGANVAAYFEYLTNLHQLGVLDVNVFRFSNDIYNKIFQNISQDSKAVAVGSSVQNMENHCSPIYFSTMKNTIDCIFLQVGREMLKNLEDHKLGLDLRSAAYGVGIRNLFKNVFSQKRFS